MEKILAELYEMDKKSIVNYASGLSKEELLDITELFIASRDTRYNILKLRDKLKIENGKGDNIWIAFYKKIMKIFAREKTLETINALKSEIDRAVEDYKAHKYPNYDEMELPRVMERFPYVPRDTFLEGEENYVIQYPVNLRLNEMGAALVTAMEEKGL